MSNCVSFQTQLASIMEILVQAAVLDITKLVDDGSAVLHLEISRREKENLALKRRLQWTESELRTARKCVMRVARQTTVDVQGEGVEAEWPRTLIIKKERLEEEYDPEATPKNCHEDTLGSCAHTTDRSGVQGEQQRLAGGRDAQRTPAKATEVSPVEELCERETVHKSESQGRFLNETGSEYRALDGLCPQYAVWETVGGTGDLEKDLEHEPGVSGLQRVGATEADCSLCPFHWLDVKPVVGDLGNKVELGGLSEFGGEDQTKEANPQPRECKEREEILSECDGQEVKNLLRVQQHFKEISLRHQVTGSAEAEELNFGMPYKRGFSPCEDSFASSRSFKSSQRSEVRERRFSCTHCGKTFTQQGHLKIHQLIHTGERPFSCAQCGKSFTHVHVLKRHLSVHTGHRPYTCTYCGKSFTLQDSLRRHQRIHTGERPYVCTYCEKRFTQGSHLKIHQLVHTGVKPFRCTECEKSFTQLHVLKRHLSVHTGQKPYNCVHCGKKFTLQDSLKRHQRLHYVEAPQFPQQLHNNERLLLQDEPNPELNLNFE